MKILVFITFFLGYLFTTLLQIKMAKFRKKVLFLEVATTIVPFFLHVTLQEHCRYTLVRSFFEPIGLKTTLLDLSTFFS